MVVFLVLLIVGIVILNIWLWLFDNIFHIGENKYKIMILTIIMGVLSGLSIVFYPKIITFLGLEHFDFTNKANITNYQTGLIFIGYLAIIITIVKLIISKFRLSKLFLINFAIFIIIFGTALMLGSKYIGEIMFIYYLFVALGEEFMKYFLGLSFFEQWHITKTDIIAFSILSAIGFAFVENLVYMLGGISGEVLTAALIGGASILITRGIVGFIVHILFTGNIGMLVGRGLTQKQLILWLIAGIALGVSLHYAYNTMIYNQYKITIPVFMIGGYMWLSYIFFQSDRIYIKDGLSA